MPASPVKTIHDALKQFDYQVEDIETLHKQDLFHDIIELRDGNHICIDYSAKRATKVQLY
jgi:hypothetical protein